jgi:hypothetical protein
MEWFVELYREMPQSASGKKVTIDAEKARRQSRRA